MATGGGLGGHALGGGQGCIGKGGGLPPPPCDIPGVVVGGGGGGHPKKMGEWAGGVQEVGRGWGLEPRTPALCVGPCAMGDVKVTLVHHSAVKESYAPWALTLR